MELEVTKVKLGDGELFVPTKTLVKTWLEKFMQPNVAQAAAPAPAPLIALPRIGEAWPGQGGVYAGIMRGENGQPDYHLIVPAGDEGHATDMTWGPVGIDVTDANSEYDGLANTIALIRSEQSHPAAEWAADLEIDGRCDFYLPARLELRLMWTNVPEVFKEGWYWSSTQCAAYSTNAWSQSFSGGGQGGNRRGSELRVRAVRRLIIQ